MRTKLKDRVLPTYTKGEEIFNMVSHIVGGGLSVVALILCVVFSCIHGKTLAIISSVIYGVMMIASYTMSSIYHGLRANTGKKVFQVLDHCSIYLFIAGTYTPFCLVTFMDYDKTLGWVMLAVVWSLAILGIVLNSIDLKNYRVFSMICYIAMGWCIIFKIDILPNLLGMTGFILLLLGGIVYTIGTILYGIGKTKKYMHSMFHLCVVLASILQFFCIFFYVI